MTTNEFNRLEQDLEAAFSVPIPELALELPATKPAAQHPRAAWKFASVAAIAAAALLGAILVVPGIGGGGPHEASARELIERSIAAADGKQSALPNYHTVAVFRGGGATTTMETWYGGPERYRNQSRTDLSDGTATLSGSAQLGDEFWMWMTVDGQVRAAHGPGYLHIEAPPTAPSLADTLRGWTQGGCFAAELAGREKVAGREANVIAVRATPSTCAYQPKPLQRATLWLDAGTSMPLKMVYEGNSTETSSSFEVTVFETFAELADSAFGYVPAAGLEVIEFSTPEELKRAFIPVVPRGSSVILEKNWNVELEPVNK